MATRSSPLIQAARSPAVRPTGQVQIDPSRHGEYPIILGDKLANSSDSSSAQFYGIRYNYKAKHNSAKQQITIRSGQSENTFSLDIDDFPEGHDPISFKYRGSVDPKSQASAEQPTALALVFNQDKQAFILEPISTELNFNLLSGPGQLRQHPQLPVLGGSADEDNVGPAPFGDPGSSASDDEPPDDENPFDYRHFLEEAKAAAATSSTAKIESSPNLEPKKGVGRFLTTSNPAQSPAVSSVTKPKPKPTTSNTQTGAKISNNRSKAKPGSSKPKPRGSGNTTKNAPKSAAIITASDEDSDDEAPPPPPQARSHPTIRAPRSHQPTDPGFSSPQITIDEASGLEIDEGAPVSRKRGRIDPTAFASRSPSNSNSAGPSPDPMSDSDNNIEDTEMRENGDSDIEALSLPPPKADTRRPSASAARRVSVAQNAYSGEDDDDDNDEGDDDFIAMMEQEVAQEEGVAQNVNIVPEDDESEVSEEE